MPIPSQPGYDIFYHIAWKFVELKASINEKDASEKRDLAEKHVVNITSSSLQPQLPLMPLCMHKLNMLHWGIFTKQTQTQR